MDLKKYETIIAQTAVYPRTVENFDVAYCYLGIIDETFELFEKIENNASDIEIKKEIGDVIWYLTAFAVFYKIPLETVFITLLNPDYEEDMFLFYRFAGKVKKFYRDNKEIPKEEVSRFITIVWNRLLQYTSQEDIGSILQMNYDKLIKRRETDTLHGDGDNREIQ
jgi:NTP pyrophosphatase (non-canonical NTP hydrolase)